MTMPEQATLKHYAGDTLGIMIRCWQDANKTIPAILNGATVTAQVRAKATDAEALATFDVATDEHEITLTLLPVHTQALPKTTVLDCQVDWLGDGTRVQTVYAAKLETTPDVTR